MSAFSDALRNTRSGLGRGTTQDDYETAKAARRGAAKPAGTSAPAPKKTGRTPFWDEVPGRWDYVTLEDSQAKIDFQLPGVAEVRVGKSVKLDVKTAPGANGATVTTKGYEPAKVTIKLTLWLPEHIDNLEAWLDLLEPSKEAPRQFGIRNAKTDLRRVSAIIVESIEGPDERSPGLFEVTIKAVEYFPPPAKNVTKTVKGGSLAGSIPLAEGLPGAPLTPQQATAASQASRRAP